MSSIQDITETEHWTVESIPKERWTEREIDIQLADVEVKLFPHDRETTEFPAMLWQQDEASFAIIKSDEKKYRS